MKITPGKYKTRSGEIKEVVNVVEGVTWGVLGSEDESWRADGRYVSRNEHDWDLVERVVVEGVDERPGSDKNVVVDPNPLMITIPATKLYHYEAIRTEANELCDALAERWLEPADVESQTARCVMAQGRLSDLLLEGGES